LQAAHVAQTTNHLALAQPTTSNSIQSSAPSTPIKMEKSASAAPQIVILANAGALGSTAGQGQLLALTGGQGQAQQQSLVVLNPASQVLLQNQVFNLTIHLKPSKLDNLFKLQILRDSFEILVGNGEWKEFGQN
jgi:hypothetical protein